jgi:drug efflux transport system ATP-binding protein
MQGEVIEIVCDRVRDAYKVLKSHAQVREIQAFGDRLNIIVDNASKALAEMQSALRSNNIEIASTRVIPPSLENVFISLISSNATDEVAV